MYPVLFVLKTVIVFMDVISIPVSYLLGAYGWVYDRVVALKTAEETRIIKRMIAAAEAERLKKGSSDAASSSKDAPAPST